MILSWNVRGLNKGARHREIGSDLKSLGCVCVALLETKVQKENADGIQRNQGTGNLKIIIMNIVMAEYGFYGIMEGLSLGK